MGRLDLYPPKEGATYFLFYSAFQLSAWHIVYPWQWGNFYFWFYCVLNKCLLVQSTSKSKHWGRAVCWGLLRRYNPKAFRKRGKQKAKWRWYICYWASYSCWLRRRWFLAQDTSQRGHVEVLNLRTIYEGGGVCFPAPTCVSSPGALTPTHCCLTLLGSCWRARCIAYGTVLAWAQKHWEEIQPMAKLGWALA